MTAFISYTCKSVLDRVLEYTAHGREEFMESTLIQDASICNLQIMAEASQHLSDDLKSTYKEIDWRNLSGFRNVLVHNYLGVDLKTVWQLIQQELPTLKQEVAEILEKLDENSEPDSSKEN